MKSLIDLHVHSRASGDNDADPIEVIEQAIARGLSGIAFTEHYSYEASEQVEALRERYSGRILLLRGVEFSTSEGHCLIFGANTDRRSLKYAPVSDLICMVAEDGGVVIPSHPYRSVNSLGDIVRSLPGIVALEGYNGCNMHAYNIRAVTAAQDRGLPYTGGSDAHAADEVGSCYTEFDDVVTQDNFLDLLKAGRFRGVDTRKISRLLMPSF
jgi:predicted metal-dependent phosphoesterase TrpH